MLDTDVVINGGHTANGDESNTHTFCEAWTDALDDCKLKLEPEDRARAFEVTNAEEFKTKLEELKWKYPNAAPRHIISLLQPAAVHYEHFVQAFVKMGTSPARVSILWGLLCLVLKLAFESRSSVEPVTYKLEKLAHQLRNIHLYVQKMPTEYNTLVEDISTISREMVNLWLGVISTFRNVTVETRPETTINHIIRQFDESMDRIVSIVSNVEKLHTMSVQAARRMDMEVIQRLLDNQQLQQQRQERPQPQSTTVEEECLPCFAVPMTRNKKFFGRQRYLQDIEAKLRPGSGELGLRSVGLWGLGGAGKTQIALAYAYSKYTSIGRPGQPDAVLWIAAYDRIAMLRSISKIVVDNLKLPRASKGADQENLFLFHTWLSQTVAKWLLILDNVDDHTILGDVWPASDRGAILVTTRQHSVVTQPVDKSIELKQFSDRQGANMLWRLTGRERPMSGDRVEDDAAMTISNLLGGHSLAINQMSAYINYHSMKFTRFLLIYRTAARKLHKEKKPGSTYLGYDHSLDTVWQVSFNMLDSKATQLLALLSYLSSPLSHKLLETCRGALTAGPDDFYRDDMSLSEAEGQLTDSALARSDEKTESLTLHRLVQEATLAKISHDQSQKAFNAAVKLILNSFEERGTTPRAELWDSGLPYLPHIDSLALHWRESQQHGEKLQASLDFCNLMCNATSFLLDNDPFGMRIRIARVNEQAYATLPAEHKSQELLADVLAALQYAILRLGDFVPAIELALQIADIRKQAGVQDPMVNSATYSRVGLAYDSAGNHDEAQGWLKDAIDVVEGDDEEVHRLQWRNHLNFARNGYSKGDFRTAEIHCKASQDAASRFDSAWDVKTYIHETFASLYLRSGQSDKAREHADLALSVIEADGATATTSSLAGICFYRSAQVAIAQGRVHDAIQQAEQARTLDRSFQAPVTTQARSTRLLYKAYLLDPEKRELAQQAKQEAHRLRASLPQGRTNLQDDSDEAYEKLVDIIQR